MMICEKLRHKDPGCACYSVIDLICLPVCLSLSTHGEKNREKIQRKTWLHDWWCTQTPKNELCSKICLPRGPAFIIGMSSSPYLPF